MLPDLIEERRDQITFFVAFICLCSFLTKLSVYRRKPTPTALDSHFQFLSECLVQFILTIQYKLCDAKYLNCLRASRPFRLAILFQEGKGQARCCLFSVFVIVAATVNIYKNCLNVNDTGISFI